MSDSIAELTAQIQDFVDAREWRKYHNAKDLAVAIAAEAGELMQHFVWQQEEQIEKRLENFQQPGPGLFIVTHVKGPGRSQADDGQGFVTARDCFPDGG